MSKQERDKNKELYSSFSSPLGQMFYLEESVWDKFPEVFLIPILAHLPWDDILRLRYTCKKWYSLFRDPWFFQKFVEARTQEPICILSQHWICQDYEVVSTTTSYNMIHQDISLGSDLNSMLVSRSVHLSYEHWLVNSSAGSFVLLERTILSPHEMEDGDCLGLNEREMMVVNPVNGSSRRISLPDDLLDETYSDIEGIFMDEEGGTYNILASIKGAKYDAIVHTNILGGVDEDGYECRTYFHYSSKTGWWEEMFDCYVSIQSHIQNPFYHKGLVHCLLVEDGFLQVHCSCQVYYAGKENWIKVELETPSPFLLFPSLFLSGGRMMLAAGVSQVDGTEQSVHIWQHDAEREAWAEVHKMPDHMLDYLQMVSTSPSPKSGYSHASGNFVCFSKINRKHYNGNRQSRALDYNNIVTGESGISELRLEELCEEFESKAVILDLSRDHWYTLSDSPQEGLSPECLFEPRFEATP